MLPAKHDQVSSSIAKGKIKNSKYEKLLRVKTDYKLTLRRRINETCKETGFKFKALSSDTLHRLLKDTKLMSFCHNLTIVNRS